MSIEEKSNNNNVSEKIINNGSVPDEIIHGDEKKVKFNEQDIANKNKYLEYIKANNLIISGSSLTSFTLDNPEVDRDTLKESIMGEWDAQKKERSEKDNEQDIANKNKYLEYIKANNLIISGSSLNKFVLDNPELDRDTLKESIVSEWEAQNKERNDEQNIANKNKYLEYIKANNLIISGSSLTSFTLDNPEVDRDTLKESIMGEWEAQNKERNDEQIEIVKKEIMDKM